LKSDENAANVAAFHTKDLPDVDAVVLKQLVTRALKAPLPGAK